MESIIPEKNYSEINIFIDSLIVYLCKVSKVDYASNEIRCKERFLLSCNVFFRKTWFLKKIIFFIVGGQNRFVLELEKKNEHILDPKRMVCY